MKVLYISHMKENSGWADAATAQILALDSVGVDVVCRNITLTSDKTGINPRISELEDKSTEGCDYCIQHVLPHHIVGSDKFKKNIAFIELESTSIAKISWMENLKLVDEVWVPNNSLANSLYEDGLGIPISVIHHPCDPAKYAQLYKPIKIEEACGKFVFYYIGDLNDRKNIDSIIRCFHSEFDKAEPVLLLLKVRKFQNSPDQLKKAMDNKLEHIKTSLRMYPHPAEYKKDVVICDDIPIQDIYALHQFGDCFVSPTHGEAWSIPTFDAMGFGSYPIASNYGGPKEYMSSSEHGILVDGSYSICTCSDSAFHNIFTGREYWFEPCEMQTRQAMRKVYEQYKENPVTTKKKWQKAGYTQVQQFSYEIVGNKMRNLLC